MDECPNCKALALQAMTVPLKYFNTRYGPGVVHNYAYTECENCEITFVTSAQCKQHDQEFEFIPFYPSFLI